MIVGFPLSQYNLQRPLKTQFHNHLWILSFFRNAWENLCIHLYSWRWACTPKYIYSHANKHLIFYLVKPTKYFIFLIKILPIFKKTYAFCIHINKSILARVVNSLSLSLSLSLYIYIYFFIAAYNTSRKNLEKQFSNKVFFLCVCPLP